MHHALDDLSLGLIMLSAICLLIIYGGSSRSERPHVFTKLFFLIGCLALTAVTRLGIIARTKVHRFNRRQLSHGQSVAPAPMVPTITSIGASEAQVVYPTSIILNGTPAWSITGGALSGYVLTSPTTLTVNSSVAIATHTLTIPGSDPAVRNAQGAYSAPASKTF